MSYFLILSACCGLDLISIKAFFHILYTSRHLSRHLITEPYVLATVRGQSLKVAKVEKYFCIKNYKYYYGLLKIKKIASA